MDVSKTVTIGRLYPPEIPKTLISRIVGLHEQISLIPAISMIPSLKYIYLFKYKSKAASVHN